MNYKIIGDSSLDLTEEMKQKMDISWAPLYISIGDITYTDDEDLDVQDMMNIIAQSSAPAKSAAPTPNDFLQYISDQYDGVFIITLSSKLSGAYNSATVAKELAQERYPGIKIHVFDSLAASAGETTLAIKVFECIQTEMSFDEIVSEGEDFINNDALYFYLDNIDTLKKNGRLGLLKGLFAQLLHIKPILGDNGNGEIEMFDKARTSQKALEKLSKKIYSTKLDAENRVLVIAHCFAKQRAETLKQMVETQRKFKDIIIVPMKGLSSVYANIGGLVCAY